MKIKKVEIAGKQVMPFTICSGIVTTKVSCLERMAQDIPELGVLTTKSIGPEPRSGNREPILAEYMPGGFVNAVGLTNPGPEEFAKELSSAKIPSGKFLLCSAFGKNPDEFVHVVRVLEPYADGFELNLSCPHAQGHGLAVGQDKELSESIIKAVVSVTKKPVFVKLSPNLPNIAEAAKSAMQSGAYGITAINTVGPKYWSVDGNPVLTNKVGGMSGRGILPFGLSAVRDITSKLGRIPIIGMGSIATAQDVKEYGYAGASIFGIGSALIGMTEREIKQYLRHLVRDLEEDTNSVSTLPLMLKHPPMDYKKVQVDEMLDVACDFKLIRTNAGFYASPGQFVFAWIPGPGEKPFSVMDDNPLTLGVLERGPFTHAIDSLKKGDSFYIRGPYGKSLDVDSSDEHVLVGGGCGIAGIYLIAKSASESHTPVKILLAAKDRAHIPYLDNFKNFGEVLVATEDGSNGKKGLVTDLFGYIQLPSQGVRFYNCGPKRMIEAVLPLERKFARDENIYSSVDWMTRCGVGLCGSCADEKGRRTCVEGPFMNP